jgi:hypothetical protein
VSEAVALLPVPPPIDVTGPVVLVRVPGVVADTTSEIEQ